MLVGGGVVYDNEGVLGFGLLVVKDGLQGLFGDFLEVF